MYINVNLRMCDQYYFREANSSGFLTPFQILYLYFKGCLMFSILELKIHFKQCLLKNSFDKTLNYFENSSDSQSFLKSSILFNFFFLIFNYFINQSNVNLEFTLFKTFTVIYFIVFENLIICLPQFLGIFFVSLYFSFLIIFFFLLLFFLAFFFVFFGTGSDPLEDWLSYIQKERQFCQTELSGLGQIYPPYQELELQS